MNGKKSKRFRQAKQQLCTCITLFCTFPSGRCTSTTWKCLISRFVEDGNVRKNNSFPELWYSPLEFNSKSICQPLTNWMRRNKGPVIKYGGGGGGAMKIFFLGTGFQCPTPSYLTKLGRPTPGVAQKKLVTHPPTKTSTADVRCG